MAGLFSVPPRANGFREKSRSPNGIPLFSSSAIHEKRSRYAASWTVPIHIPIPGVPGRSLRVPVPNLAAVHHMSVTHFGRRRGTLMLLVACVAAVVTVFSLAQRVRTSRKQWSAPLFTGEPSTLVFEREDLQQVWQWEIASGHYPSSREVPRPIRLTAAPLNPALPPKKVAKIPSRYRPPGASVTHTVGHGAKRVYLDNQSRPPHVEYPPRPVPGSVADMDVIMDLCDFSTEKYVRDCLEVLRLSGGLDNGKRVRRGKFDEWRYIFVEEGEVNTNVQPEPVEPVHTYNNLAQASSSADPNAGLQRKPKVEWESAIRLPATLVHHPYHTLPSTCDPENQRLFHMFWTGPFTDKPYLALLSFLFTQNVRLHLHEEDPDAVVCRPQFWMWVNPGPAAAVPNPNARHDMFEQLKSNPWASPFLHPRFKDVIMFKMWNTTEQLDGVPEIKDEWRALKDTLFNSGGHIVSVRQDDSESESSESSESSTLSGSASAAETAASKVKSSTGENDALKFVGSKSADSYDRLSVILSDMARFILCHRFGGVYLDADTIFLRDWEELWGWKGAFAYRWSRLENYNTAVLRMNKGSALGTFLFRTALKNGLDFHPMTVSKYTKDAYLEPLLLRLPDALFDSAWLNTENYQRDRPPQPYFTQFGDFFDTPSSSGAAPAALGFEGFFRGAYSYHFHNFWWKPFDASRNWPDLGSRFIEGERQARLNLNLANNVTNPEHIPPEEHVADDKRDLDWATVLKRTFEAYIRGERPNMYGEWLEW
ncbi:glycosyltransferase family 32 protein [Auriscalpium vulgare]|uniref:Glycosyltransferase family 32 protein n=1 Tax=Auriscalpium vulgare TaxID=40419 RepID=A0ACB8SAB9_9AGAM|nr:glycosyltransferase family 32 protein [Auriscalpium vulgare]